jgi:diguanylate cyclase
MGLQSISPNHRMHAEQTVARMNLRLKLPLSDKAREGLIDALTSHAERGGLVYGQNPFRAVPPRWSISGLLSRVMLRIKPLRTRIEGRDNLSYNDSDNDKASTLANIHAKIKRSGGAGLLIALLITLCVGIVEFGEPAELGLQIGRDALKQSPASGDIIIVTKDDATAARFGGLPWARRYDAQLVDRLREMGAKRIVFNNLLAQATNAQDDKALAAAFDRAKGKVWISIDGADASNPAMLKSVVPIPLFRTKTQQAHGNIWFGALGQIKQIEANVKIDGIRYPSKAEILAGVETTASVIKPDYAIDMKSIPKLSAADILDGNVNADGLTDKTVFVVANSERLDPAISVLGQGRAPSFYPIVIAAETLKQGMPIRLGFIIPLLLAIGIGIWWMVQREPRLRVATIAVGFSALVALILIGDRVGLHMDVVPALILLVFIALRETRQREINATTALHGISGLPALQQLMHSKSMKPAAVIALNVERYNYLSARMTDEAEKQFALGIAVRMNILAPACEVHQGDDGVFVFVAPSEGSFHIPEIAHQLQALFTFSVTDTAPDDIGVCVGVDDDANVPLSSRTRMAIDRAQRVAYTRLRRIY